jgi:hypothetical protein
MGATSARPGHGPKYIPPAGSSLRAVMMPSIRRALILGLLAAVACGGAGAADHDRVAVYAEVIRHMTTEQGQPSGFRVIYVLDRIVGNDADPDDPAVGRAIDSADQRALAEALRDVAPLEFVPTRSEVVGPMEDGGRVRNEGIFLTVGPISGEDERVLVPATTYLGNLAATWQTWVVERVGDRWHVTGTEGPVAIS